MNNKTGICIALACSLTLFGCASTDEDRTRAQGVGAGAVIGGLLGAVLGDSSEAAAIGAFVGAVAGDIYAKSVVRKKEEFANTESYMRAVIQDAETRLAKTQTERSKLKANYDSYQTELANLEQKQADAKTLNAAIKKQNAEKSKDLTATENLLAALNQEIELQNKVLQEERNVIPVALVNHSETAISALESEKRQLELLKGQLASLDRRKLY